MRDLVLGIQLATPDGTVSRSGSKVIKNVAGYDLAKLMAGAYGTLGVVCEVSIRLHPVPHEPLTVVIRGDDPAALAARARELTHLPLEAEALDLRWDGDGGAILIRLAGPSARPSARRAIDGGEVAGDDEGAWAAQRDAQRGPVVVRVSTTQTGLAAVLGLARELRRHAASRAPRSALPGCAWSRPTPRRVERIRSALPARRTACCSTRPPSCARAVDPWGGAGRRGADAPREGPLRPAGHLQPRPHVRSSEPMTAFDVRNPPEPDLIDDCVHCGFCLPTCPTYALWGEEMDSPRGRIVLMRAGHEEDGPLTAPQVQAWDNCLGCMACVTACPSAACSTTSSSRTRARRSSATGSARAWSACAARRSSRSSRTPSACALLAPFALARAGRTAKLA